MVTHLRRYHRRCVPYLELGKEVVHELPGLDLVGYDVHERRDGVHHNSLGVMGFHHVLDVLENHVLHVFLGAQDLLQAHLGRRLYLRGHGADVKHLAAHAQRAGHRNALVDLNAFER